jgi:Mg2+-importing ATPase
LRQFESPLVLILVFGAVISLILRDWIDAWIILVIVLGSTLLGFAQEWRASAAIAALRKRLALTTQARRGGSVQAVLASSVVPGDIILLSAGNLIPADGVVLDAEDFLVSEASLTGESFPVEKRPGVAPPQAPPAGRTNCVFLGTSVRSGTATTLVVRTGRDTAFGAIAASLKARAPETEFARGVRQFGYLLLRVMVVMVLFVLTVNLLFARPVIDSLLFAVALAVGLSPELLPAIVSVTLSAGARAMARRGVIIRRLEAIENLGSIDILCTDKTGTLTEGVLELSGVLDPAGQPSPAIAQLAYLNAAFETGIDNPLDAAIVASGTSAGMSTGRYRKVDEIPYDFMRKRLTIVVASEDDPSAHRIVTKGAFVNVLAICTKVEGLEGPLDEATRVRLDAFYREKSEGGFRVLAIATKRVPAKERYDHTDEQDLSFAGFLLFVDPPKPEVRKTIHDLAALGIRIKIVSGDNRYVTAHIAEAIGLDRRAVLTGEKIAKLKDEALWYEVEHVDLFAEIDPQQKERIVRALQRNGHAVGYMGDGINDAPALYTADIGISVDQAVDVARESADVILLRRDLDILRSGVRGGRRTFANTLKYICITTSANFGNMASMALATLFLPFLPLVAKQILLNNFLSDLPSMAIATDNVDADRIARSQRWRIRDVQAFMIVFGLISTAFDLLTFMVLLSVFAADAATFQTAWFVVSLLTELAVVLVLRTQRSALRSRPSRLLLWTTVAVGVFALAIPYSGRLAAVFDFVPLPADILGIMLLIVVGYVLATEAAKLRFFRHSARR